MAAKKTGKKFDQGKLPLVQGCYNYFPRALLEVARSSKFGHLKYSVPYSEKNWQEVEDGINRYTDGLGRHLAGEQIDGEMDPEGAQHNMDIMHAGAVAWCALARLELMLLEKEKNN